MPPPASFATPEPTAIPTPTATATPEPAEAPTPVAPPPHFTIERVSVSSDGLQGNGGSNSAIISGDGRLVVFRSSADNLAPGDTNESLDIFVHDVQTGKTERISFMHDEFQGESLFHKSTVPVSMYRKPLGLVDR